jgi:hypothetical protein
MEEEMNKEWKQSMQAASRKIAAAVLGLTIAGVVAGESLGKQNGKESARVRVEGEFYCNIKALSSKESARHKELGEKMAAAQTATVETEKGYEFQYSPEGISVGEVAEWVAAESKCCPFFDFHIDLENRGKLVCLRLTGKEGIKAFIRSEFHI